ncbi:M48 family metallopeptidase [Sulfitobacter sp. KE34]|uniref:M48 family metallopeptidase n=1 Tax=unclassified Sulfitobacter TaxID=196795 RepID=UPI0023E0B8DF|nr:MULTISPECIES: SprT family zinc-dependent metalloprotease [unclassified Sulfitobacter]MDF3351098.1 M48 family metallopeptidase [Sulfitobacter sp. KE12]MDF3354770.1 M48 family metallopeptidase [Sulfitobacter sp. KE27]MDF3358418.1 M48 family metallopeptidase [Sulfitobacter sp. KE33]MDF3365842.1 M48 family metallopeptidase [Sulfitobacter sp. Ks34]MDF3369221.1 M48 family metallopeptidase [Sulfitobacter sp. Ks43]
MTVDPVLTYGGETLSYRVQTDGFRTTKIAIHVEPDGEIIVDAPESADPAEIRRAMQKRARWVFTQVQKARERFKHVRDKEYVSGEEVLYLGRRYVLKVIKDDTHRGAVKLKGNRLEVPSRSGSPESVRAGVWAWYRVKARDYFDRRLAEWEQKLPWVSSRPPFRLQEMEKRWGSCTASGEIILNPHLIKAPRECIDYVILHELAHLRHHNHSPEFWNTINFADPDWQRKKALLDGAAEQLTAK